MGQSQCLPIRRSDSSAGRKRARTNSATTACVPEDVELVPALASFKAVGARELRKSRPDGSYEPLWEAACGLVEAILLGVTTHLPELKADCKVFERTENTLENDEHDTEAVAIEVRFNCPRLVGEVATPSRFCYEVHIQEEIRFALHLPHSGESEGGAKMKLGVSGFDLMELPGMSELRRRIKADCGEKYTLDEALAWWEKHKDESMRDTKFWRVYTSLMDTSAKMVMSFDDRMIFFCGFLLAPNCRIQSLTFQRDLDGKRVRIEAQRGPPLNEEEEELIERGVPLFCKGLAKNRPLAEKLVASASNFGATLYGADVGQPGGDARIITKLFSAAERWGPGEKGWQRYDKTWLCRDQKNRLGRTVWEQGRLIWSVSGEPARASGGAASPCLFPAAPQQASSAASPQNGVGAQPDSKRSGSGIFFCCRRRTNGASVAAAAAPFVS